MMLRAHTSLIAALQLTVLAGRSASYAWPIGGKDELRSNYATGKPDDALVEAHDKIIKQTVTLGGVSVTRVTFGVGAKWSSDLKLHAGTPSCEIPHVALVLSGTLHVAMDDESQEDFSKNDVILLPLGHDAWSVGNEPCTFVEFSRGNDYYRSRSR